jgi:hypothetical protein
MRARYYDARTAAFLSREPLWPLLATPGALNPYQYAARDPNRFVDITGAAEAEKNDLWNYVRGSCSRISSLFRPRPGPQQSS